MDKISYAPAGDQGIVMNFSDRISEDTNRRIRALIDRIREAKLAGVTEVIPSFTSLLVLYDCRKTTYQKLKKKLMDFEKTPVGTASEVRRIHKIPVCYEGEFAEDISYVAEHAGLTVPEVIDLHAGRDYLIYMLGFLPGFVYLGGMDERLFTPRLSAPRTKIPAGSVGIGGEQTGIYPLESPGGWQLIGRTPVRVYDPDRAPSILYEMGEYIRFVPITAEQYSSIGEQIKNGTWKHEVEEIRK